MIDWTLKPGESIARKVLHERFGGRRQGGIGPSSLTPNVFVFSDPASGAQHGYVDGWQDDGCFHYTGEGQRGDQRMVSGNAAILRHRAEGKALRMFEGAGGLVRYLDEFLVDDERPFYTTDAPETGGGPVRKVIVFRLRPVTTAPHSPTSPFHVVQEHVVDFVEVENQLTERFYVEPDREPYEAERREATLVLEFRSHLRSMGHTVNRLKVVPAGEAKPIFSDLYVASIPLLVEAKGSVERGCIRMGIGQLIDYRRFVQTAVCALLLPERPREDLVQLIQAAGLSCFWPSGKGFTRLDPP
jgi:hypothetical protein